MSVNDWRAQFRERMSAAGMTYARIAVALGMKPPSVYHFMEPASNPGIESLQKIAHAINCDVCITFVPRTVAAVSPSNDTA